MEKVDVAVDLEKKILSFENFREIALEILQNPA